MKNESYFLDRIKKLQSSSQTRIESLNERFNQLKIDIRDLNDYLLMNQSSFSKEDSLSSHFKEIEKQISDFLQSERKEHISAINAQFADLEQVTSTSTEMSKLERESIRKIIGEFQSQLEEAVNELMNKVDMSKQDKKQTQINLIDGINNEFNNVFTLISEEQQMYEEKRTGYINSIQDMLMKFAAQFKLQQKEKHDFEEKIVFLLEELCKKMTEIKKGKN